MDRSVRSLWGWFLVVVFAASCSGQNLLSNGGFESGLTEWNINFGVPLGNATATVSLETSDVFEGSQAARFEVTSIPNPPSDWASYDRNNPPFTGTVGASYLMTFSAKKVGTAATHLAVAAAHWGDEIDNLDYFKGHSLLAVTPTNSEWSTHYLCFTVPAETQSTVLRFWIISDTSDLYSFVPGEYLLDDVQIEAVPAAGLFNGGFEYDFAGWRTQVFGGGIASYDIVTGADVYAGSNAARFEVVDETGDATFDLWDNPVALDGMRSVKVSCYAKKDVAYDQDFLCHFAEFDGAGNWLGNGATIPTWQADFSLTDTYQKFEFFYPVVRSGAGQLSFGFKPAYAGAYSYGAFIIDEITFEQAPLLPNGDMEMGTRMWRSFVGGAATLNATVETSDVYEGSQAIRMASTNNDASFVAFDRFGYPVPVTPNHSYKCTVAAKKINATDTILSVLASDLNQDQAWITDHIGHFYPPTDSYGEYELYFRVGSDVTSTAIGFRIEDATSPGTHVSGEYLIDAVQVEELTGVWNGGFEDDLLGWRTFVAAGAAGMTTVETSDVYEGSQAARFAVTDSSNFVFFDRWDYPVPVEPGRTYMVTAAAKKVGSANTALEFLASALRTDGSWVTDHFVHASPSSSEYGVYTLYFTAGVDTTQAAIGFRIKDGSNPGLFANGDYLLDDVQIADVTGELWNGDFESDLMGWRTFVGAGGVGGTTVETSDVYQGGQAARFAVTDSNGDVFFDRWEHPVTVQPGRVYECTVAAKKVGTADTALQFLASDLRSDGSFITDHFVNVSPSASEYGVYTLLFVPDGEAARTVIGFRIKDGADPGLRANGEYLIDDVTITDVTGTLWNADFEQQLSGWRTFVAAGGAGTATVESSDVYQGAYAARYSVTDSSADVFFDRWDNQIDVQPGQTYKCTVAVKKADSANTALQFLASDVRADGSFITDHFVNLYPSEAGYDLYSLVFTADAEAAKTVIGFRIKDGADPGQRANGSYLIDDIRFSTANSLKVLDLDNSDQIDLGDVGVLSSEWLDSATGTVGQCDLWLPADVNLDCAVDMADFAEIATNYMEVVVE